VLQGGRASAKAFRRAARLRAMRTAAAAERRGRRDLTRGALPLLAVLCRTPLAMLRSALTARLAARLVPLCTGAAGAAGVRAALDRLTAAEARLLSSLHVEPAPLLALTSHEAHMASWILMRLALLGPLPPKKAEADEAEAGEVLAPPVPVPVPVA